MVNVIEFMKKKIMVHKQVEALANAAELDQMEEVAIDGEEQVKEDETSGGIPASRMSLSWLRLLLGLGV
jgi:hypothetical protein